MKKFTIISAAMFLALAAISCRKEGFEDKTGTTVLNVVITDGTKTALGEKEADAYPNYWKTGDEISVNGVASDALDESFDGKSSAAFTFGDALETPYYAAYPASAVSDYDSGAAVITVPGTQKYVEGSYDPEAFIMTGVSSTEGTVSISAKVGIFHLSLTGEGNISKVVLSGLNGEALSGDFTTDFSSLTPKTVSDKVELVCGSPVALPAEFFLCIPAGTYAKLQVEAFDDEGGVMSKNATLKEALPAGGMFSAPTLAFNPSYDFALEASLKGVTTSSAAFTWTHTGDKDFDISKPYTIALYSDQACSNKVISLQIPADASCWDGKQPCFVFGGLESGKTYYFRAEDTEDADNTLISNVVEATTGEFTNVAYDELEGSATVGDVILAENFNEWGYGTDETLGAAGFYNNDATLAIYGGDVDMETVSLQKPSSTGRRLFNQTTVRGSGTRVEWWGFAGNSSVYLRAGYLRVTTTSSGNRTHIVTPKLAAIPEGKLATVEVTARMLRTESDNDFGVLVQTGTMNSNYTTGGSAPVSCKLQSGFTDSDAYPFNMTTKGSWETHTVTIQDLTNANSLAFGSVSNVDTKNRFYIAEITVRLTALYDPSPLSVKCSDKSSSTLAFKWTEGGSEDDDIANAYTATLYKDQACTQVDQTFDFPAEMGAWNGKQPCFVFGGLKPSTDYWLKVTDTTNGIESNPVKATTDDFTVVTLPSEITGTGVVLAEDFGELRWDFEKCFGAAGYFPSSTSDFSNTGVSSYRKSGDSGEKTFKGQGTALGKSRLNDWVTDSNVYIHPGSLKLGTSSARGWILTPEFKVPEGKKAVVNVTVTAARHDGNQNKDWAVAVLSPDLAKANPSEHTADFGWPDVDDAALYQTINITNSSVWNTRTVSGLEIHSGDRIAFGGIQGGDGKKGRVWISDLTVEVTAFVDDIAGAKKLSIIGDSISSFEGWLPEGNKYFADYYIGGGLQDWTKTYWGALCTKYMAGKLQMEKNISWTGSCVAQDTRTGSSYRPAFVTRYGKSNVGATYALNSIGSPDIVIIYGGTNDRYNSGYGLSDVNSTPDDAEFDAIFKKSNDNLVVTSFVQAYVKLINMVHADCPDAKIINIIGDYVTLEQIASIKKISDHYTFCKYVDFSNGGSGNPKIGKLNGVHPNIDGMDYMAKTIFGELGDWMLED